MTRYSEKIELYQVFVWQNFSILSNCIHSKSITQ